MIAILTAAHEEGKSEAAFDIDEDKPAVVDAKEKQILDLLLVKHWALKYAVGAACTILRVDQIIMAKKAGGPKARPGGGPMDTQVRNIMSHVARAISKSDFNFLLGRRLGSPTLVPFYLLKRSRSNGTLFSCPKLTSPRS